MEKKRIIMSLGMLAFVGAVVVGGTGAFFSDTETSTGNVFTAGSVSIDFDGIDHTYGYNNGTDPVDDYFETSTSNNIPFFTFNDMKPRDAGTLDFGLANGANDAYVCGLIGGTTEPTEDPDLALYENLNFFNSDGDQITPGDWIDLGGVDANQTGNYEVDYCFGDWDGTSCDVDPSVDYNDAQNGSFGASLTLFAVQQRNNENFSCDQLTLNNGVPTYTPEASAGEITSFGAVYTDATAQNPSYAGVYMEFVETGIVDASQIELRLTLDDGSEYSTFAQSSVLTDINADGNPITRGGTVVTVDSRTSSSWSPQDSTAYPNGTFPTGAVVESAEVFITLGDGSVLTSSVDETGFGAQNEESAALPTN